MLHGKRIALLSTFALSFVALQATAANITIQPPISPPSVNDVLILDNTWRVETSESADAWAWSFVCDGCSILSYNVFYIASPPAPPSTPGMVDWQGDGSATSITLPGYANDNTVAGSVGGFAFPAFTGNGVDVLIGELTIQITASTGSVMPFFQPQDGIFGGGPAVPTTLDGVSWVVPEPGTALLLAVGLAGLGLRRRL